MKKFIYIFILLITMMTHSAYAFNLSDLLKNNFEFNINNIDSINVDGRILLPLRNMADYINCSVEWDGSTKTAIIEKLGHTVEFTINSDTFIVDGKARNIATPAIIKDDKTYIPIRDLSDSLGLNIDYNSDTKQVTISL